MFRNKHTYKLISLGEHPFNPDIWHMKVQVTKPASLWGKLLGEKDKVYVKEYLTEYGIIWANAKTLRRVNMDDMRKLEELFQQEVLRRTLGNGE